MDRKKNRNQTECNRGQPDPRLRLLHFRVLSVAGCFILKLFKNRPKTGRNQLQPVFKLYIMYPYIQLNYVVCSKRWDKVRNGKSCFVGLYIRCRNAQTMWSCLFKAWHRLLVHFPRPPTTTMPCDHSPL